MQTSDFMNDPQTHEIELLRRKIRNLQIVVVAAVVVVASLALLGAAREPPILRAKELIIVDAQGHDRILLGAPVIDAQRSRKNAETPSLVLLGPDGSDRVLVGQAPREMTMNGRIEHRPDDGWGLQIFDPKGNERGGIGYLGRGRVAVALDDPNADAIGMMVDDTSHYAGMLVNYPSPVGADDSAFEVGVKDRQVTMTMRDPQGKSRARLRVEGDGQPVLELHDAATALKQ